MLAWMTLGISVLFIFLPFEGFDDELTENPFLKLHFFLLLSYCIHVAFNAFVVYVDLPVEM